MPQIRVPMQVESPSGAVACSALAFFKGNIEKAVGGKRPADVSDDAFQALMGYVDQGAGGQYGVKREGGEIKGLKVASNNLAAGISSGQAGKPPRRLNFL